MLSNLVRALLVLLLVAGVPALSYFTAKPSRIRLIPRSALYLSAVLSQWLLGALGGLVIWATLPGPSSVGLRAIPPGSFFSWTVLLTLVSFAGIAVMAWLERVGWWPQESEITRLLLPETLREKLLAVFRCIPIKTASAAKKRCVSTRKAAVGFRARAGKKARWLRANWQTSLH